MSRIQADNYNKKQNIILDKAARLFADIGYPNARMMDIAKACGASKSMLYHYFPKKENLLYAILFDHLEDVIASLNDLLSINTQNGTELIHAFVDLFVGKSTKARTRHTVAVLDIKYLPKKEQKKIKDLEHEVIRLSSKILQQAHPDLPKTKIKFFALLLIGMINSMDTWTQKKGRYSPEQIVDEVSNLFLSGFLATK